MASTKGIYCGIGGTAPGEWENGRCEWHNTKVYVHPLIDGISPALWQKIVNTTNEARPMCGKDGSKVYADFEEWGVFRRIGSDVIRIANITEVG